VVTEADHFVHVSATRRRTSWCGWYQMIARASRSRLHGEARHLAAHAHLARECQVEEALVIENGDLIRLAAAAPRSSTRSRSPHRE